MRSSLTQKSIAVDVKWTKEYIGYIKDAQRQKDWDEVAKWANEISAIWATLAGDAENKAVGLPPVGF